MFFDDGSVKTITPKEFGPSTAYNYFSREIVFDPLEEFSGFGGSGS
jgi:hypothetical protein